MPQAPRASTPTEVLAGLVERVTFHNDENGFCVLRVKARGQRDLITVLGHAAMIAAGEFVQASGTWINDRTHGVQFRASFLKAAAPTTIEGIEKYLGSGMIRGIDNNGHVLAEDGTVRPREAWSLAIPGRVFGLLRASGLTTRPKTFLWGHSAGGQFVHRLLATQPHEIFEAVGAANSGWYTLPTLDRKYPEGLGGIGQMQDEIARLLAYPLVIFSGDRDIDTGSENLPRHDAAMAQGPHRLARSQYFLDYGQAAAARLGLPCNWRRVVVPGVAHKGMRMSDFAARYWLSPSA